MYYVLTESSFRQCSGYSSSRHKPVRHQQNPNGRQRSSRYSIQQGYRAGRLRTERPHEKSFESNLPPGRRSGNHSIARLHNSYLERADITDDSAAKITRQRRYRTVATSNRRLHPFHFRRSALGVFRYTRRKTLDEGFRSIECRVDDGAVPS